MTPMEVNGRKVLHVAGIVLHNFSDCTLCTYRDDACPQDSKRTLCIELIRPNRNISSFFIEDTPEAIAALVTRRLEGNL